MTCSRQAGCKFLASQYHPLSVTKTNLLGRITGALWVNIILFDYVKTILNLNRSNTIWTLDPRVNSEGIFDPTGTPQGIGNQVSVEFNLIYRWHATVSNKDQRWAEEFYQTIFPNKDPSTLGAQRFPSRYVNDDYFLHRHESSRILSISFGMNANSS